MIIFFLLGVTALTSQVIYIRELTVVFYGNELSFSIILSVWLLFGGLGGILGSFLLPRLKSSKCWAGWLFLVTAFLLPLVLYLIRLSRNLLGVPLGEVIGLSSIFGISLAALALPAFFLSLLFILTVEIMKLRNPAREIPTRGYLLEAAGSGLAGLMLSFFLLSRWDSFVITLGLSAILVGCGFFLLVGKRTGITIGLLTGAVFLLLTPLLQQQSLKTQWAGFNLLKTENSRYGNLVVARQEDQISFFENGFLLASYPDPQSRETAIHPALAIHPAPYDVLLIGDTSPGSLYEILKHPVRKVTAVEMDPAWIQLKKTYDPTPLSLDGREVNLVPGDGRRFLKKTDERYDVMINTLPEPSTLLLNRFYTLEFFEEVKRHLKPGGVFALTLPGMANYPNRELLELLGSIQQTLRLVFPSTVLLPLESTHFLASSPTGILKDDAQDYLEPLKERHIRNLFFHESYLPFYLTPDRKTQLSDALRSNRRVLLNRDRQPSAQFYTTLFWSSYASPAAKTLFQKLMATPLWVWYLLPVGWLIISLGFRHFPFFRKAATLNSMGWTGFSEISFEMIILLAYQAVYGYAYLWIAVILASFMIGLVLGSWLTLKLKSPAEGLLGNLTKVQFGIIFYPLFLLAILKLLENEKLTWVPLMEYGFPFLAAIAGFFGGLQFPLAQRILAGEKSEEKRSTGLVYGIDLLGSCLGALMAGCFLVPVLGTFRVCLLLTLINLTSWLLLMLVPKTVQPASRL
ncbi:MAG: hypothetical protein JW893_02850 [Candidatus Omnitrophica bacterium]|nr:hypothetical protein [Candidatus Omnitrophota bacterium]